MQIKLKTRDVLASEGWEYDDGDGIFRRGAEWIDPGVVANHLGSTFEVLADWDGAPVHACCGYAPASAFYVARVKTREEFRASGWTDLGAGFEPRTRSNDVTFISDMLPHLGRWIPTAVRAISRENTAVFDGWHYTPGMFATPLSLPPRADEAETESSPDAPTTAPEVASVAKRSKKPFETSAESRAAQLAFRDADESTARGMVTCGFELETQETEGHRYGTIQGREETREDILSRIRDGEWTFEGLLILIRRANGTDSLPTRSTLTWYEVVKRLAAVGINTWEQLVGSDYCSQEQWDRTLDHLRQSRYLEPHEWLDSLGVHEKVVAGSDGSVRGFEFRTEGGLDYDTFNAAAQSIFKLSHEIDTGCSFHVHVAVSNVKHTFGERMQQALTEFVLEHSDEVPATVRDRWQTEGVLSYFSPGINSEKYAFVRAHPQRTWEFRCFGNVLNADDGKRCLDLAIRALQYAYSVTSGKATLLSDSFGLTHSGWATLAREAMLNRRTMTAEYEAKPNAYQTAA